MDLASLCSGIVVGFTIGLIVGWLDMLWNEDK